MLVLDFTTSFVDMCKKGFCVSERVGSFVCCTLMDFKLEFNSFLVEVFLFDLCKELIYIEFEICLESVSLNDCMFV